MYFYRIDQTLSQNQFGGKAFRLAFLAQHGYPVPDAVFLSAQSYFDFLKQNVIFDNIQSLHLQSKQKQLEQAETIRRSLLNKPFPPALRSELEQITAYFKNPVSVRSSGLEEDSEKHSFAGQFATILHVQPFVPDIEQAIRKVWASMWEPKATMYRIHNNLPFYNGMAVIIQSMLHPVFAGVAFSNNPLTGHGKEQILFEYVEGLGNELVDGARTPHTLIWDKGRHQYQMPEEIPGQFLRIFNKLAVAIEQLDAEFESGVDVEWAVDGRQFWLLQARPITHTEDIVEWTNENVDEVIPDIITPYSWSILGPLTNSAFARLLHFLGVKDFPKNGLFRLFKGKVYFNNTAFNRLLAGFYVGEQLRKRKIWPAIRYVGRLIPVAVHLGLFLVRLEKKIRSHLKQHPQILNRINEQTEVKAEFGLSSINAVMELHQKTMFLHLADTVFAELYFQLLDKLCRNLLPKGTTVSARMLLSGNAGIESARSGRALWEITQLIQEDESISNLFHTTAAGQIATELSAMPQARAVRDAIREFLKQYGHNALHEFELLYPRWQEDPVYIYASLKSMLTKAEVTHSEKADAQRFKEQKQLRLETQRKIFFLLRPVFNYTLRKAEFFAVQRENLKQAFIKAHFVLKKKLLRLVPELNLKAPEDIFYLKQDEITAILQSKYRREDISETIHKRRLERELYMKYNHPIKLKQIGARWIAINEKDAVQGDLTGIPCSAGIVEGTAKIIITPESAGAIPDGSILVAHSANPGWTPLFIPAAGLITEVGGALSHSAIIAREYGLPMIAAVPGATRFIKNGQRIRMDGEKGLIEILT